MTEKTSSADQAPAAFDPHFNPKRASSTPSHEYDPHFNQGQFKPVEHQKDTA